MAAKKAAAKKKTTAKKVAAPARRADFGSPVDSYVEKQKGEPQAILVALRKLVEAAMPKATSAIKWGMPVYELNGKMAAAMRVTKAGVALILSGDPASFKDPKGLLEEGSAKNMRQVKVTSLDTIPRKEIVEWLKVAAN